MCEFIQDSILVIYWSLCLFWLQVGHSFDCCGILACFEFRKPEGPMVIICSQDCFCSLGFSSVAEVLVFEDFLFPL